jgi:hypothetical protein
MLKDPDCADKLPQTARLGIHFPKAQKWDEIKRCETRVEDIDGSA